MIYKSKADTIHLFCVYLLLLPLFLLLFCSRTKEHLNEAEMMAQELSDLRQQITCFVYHRFGEARYPSTNIDEEVFEKQLHYLKTEGYQVLTLGEALNYTGDSERPIVVLTVDDAYASFMEKGMPLLRKYGFKATLFVNTATVGGKTYLSWEDLRSLQKEGIEMGNHSHSHAFFLNVPDREQKETFEKDVAMAQQLLTEKLGVAPRYFAYPYGEYSHEIQKSIVDMGFEAALAQHSGIIYKGANRWALPRFPMGGVVAHLSGFKEKSRLLPLPVLDSMYRMPARILQNNSKPELHLKVSSEGFQTEQLQCFIAGRKVADSYITTALDSGIWHINVEKLPPLRQRRTLCTLTVPDQQGQWYWYSCLWIMPENQREE